MKMTRPTSKVGWILAGTAGVLLFGGAVAVGTTAFAADGENDSDGDDGDRQPVSVQDDSIDSQSVEEGSGESQSEATQILPPEAQIPFDEAGEIALAEVGEGFVGSVDFDNDGAPVWEVDVYTEDGQEHELKINAEDGSVVKHETDQNDGDDDNSGSGGGDDDDDDSDD
ncbi:MAG: PepSY domain-containing protein [Stackebrandtia sp.]